MCTRSAPAPASAGVAAPLAPDDSSARAFASVRFQTVTASPRRSMPSTIPLPSSPVPRNATFAIADLPVESTPVLRVRRHLLLVVLLCLGPAEAGHYRNVAAEAGHDRNIAGEPPRLL